MSIVKSVLWVGLSEKKTDSGTEFVPLNSETTSGKLLSEVESSVEKVNFIRTNLVKMAPLNTSNKLRYPTKQECEDYYGVLENEIQNNSPRIVFLLGKQVSEFVLRKVTGDKKYKIVFFEGFRYGAIEKDGVSYIGIHHPSHIAVYKRKEKDLYVQALIDLVNLY